jgi:hypothetical protein
MQRTLVRGSCLPVAVARRLDAGATDVGLAAILVLPRETWTEMKCPLAGRFMR